MRTRRQRNADVKLMLAATAAVLIGGFVLAAGIYVAVSGGGNSTQCGRLPAGPVDTVRDDLETGGPFYQTGGGNCSFILALDDGGDIVAYKQEQPTGCTLKLKREQLVCDGGHVDPADLAQYPVSTIKRDDVDVLLVDLTGRPDASSTTTSRPA